MANEHTTRRAQRDRDNHATGKATRSQLSEAHSTMKAARGEENAPRPYDQHSTSAAIRQKMLQTDTKSSTTEWPREFILDGVKYKNEGVLSDSSGEAIVFTVTNNGKKYALKVYYYDPDHRPNHDILEKIRRLGGSGLLVNIVSHGLWENPSNSQKNDYELMDFCEGGSMDGTVLDGDEDTLRNVALRIASAIDFLAKHGILHRDIKPANFFYADKEKTQIVLADFGISVECKEGETCCVDDMRSPVYAAPEFYSRVPGEPAEIGVKSDYYSLGVALLCLWLGKTKLTANESQLLRDKMNESLPQPKGMSAHMMSLIKALTRLKMTDRADFEDIQQWAQGKNLSSEEILPTNFEVVFNSSKGLVAHSPSELAQMLVADKALGRKYLYSGRVTRWLEAAGANEVAVNVEEISERIYPSNQNAGLMAVAYMLDPAMPYTAPDGTVLADPGKISIHIAERHAQMASEVTDPESDLRIYLRASGLGETLDTVQKYLDSAPADLDDMVKGLISSYYLALLLNPEIPLVMHSSDKGLVNVDTVEEVLEVLHHNGDEFGYLNAYMLMSPAFVVWLSRRNPALAGKIRLLQTNSSNDVSSADYKSNSPYRIAYELDPAADFYFNTNLLANDRCYSVEETGKFLEYKFGEIIDGTVKAEDGLGFFMHIEDTRMGDYLRARGDTFMTFLQWYRFCLDDESEDNSSKPGPYNFVIGIFKGIAGFLGHAPYYPLSGKKLMTPEDLKTLSRSTVADAIGGQHLTLVKDGRPQPWLDAWLTLFYQENPALDLSKQFTYEKETAKYLELLGEYASGNYYVNRYNEAIEEIDDAAGSIKKSDRGVKMRRNIFLLLGGIPTIIMLLGLIFGGLPDVNPIKDHIMPTFIICSVGSICFSATLWGFGFWTTILPGAVSGAVLTLILYLGFALFPTILLIAIIAVLAYYLILRCWQLMHRHKVDTDGKKINGDEFEYRQLDALYYAYKDTGNTLQNVVTKYAEMQESYDQTNRANISFDGWRWVSVVWMLFALWYFWTPALSGDNSWTSEVEAVQVQKGKWVLGQWKAKYAGGKTTILCNIDSIEEGKKIYGTMVIAGQAPVEAQGVVSSDNDTLPNSFTFYVKDAEIQKKSISVDYDKYNKKYSAYYYDRNGIMHEMTVLSTPTDNVQNKNTSGNKKAKVSKPKQDIEKSQNIEPQQKAESESGNIPDNEESPVSGLWQDTM